MYINGSADIGQNLTGLVQKLAEQIGVTADKVFPWYVKQQVIEGWCMLLIPAIIILVCILVLVPGLIMVCRAAPPKSYGAENPVKIVGRVMSILSGIVMVLSILVLCLSASTSVSQINNPEYHATKAFLQDVGNLVPGK